MMSDEQGHFVEKARASLDERSRQLSPALTGRLRAARRTALASQRQTTSRLWLPAAAATALVVVVVGVSWFSRPSPDQGISIAQIGNDSGVADFDMLTRDAPLELYQDLEFYYWLDQGAEHAG